MRSKFRLQFSIATLSWLTICVASFFGGRYWDQIAVPRRAGPVVAPAGNPASLLLTAGRATIVNASVPVQRMLTADPAIVSVVPVTHNSFEVRARQAGKTRIDIWGDSTNPAITYNVTVR